MLAEETWLREREPDSPLLGFDSREEMQPLRPPSRGRAIVTIDDEPVSFDIVGQGEEWVGRASLMGFVLTIESRGFPIEGLRLARVKNPEPYIAGSRAQLKQWEDNARPFD